MKRSQCNVIFNSIRRLQEFSIIHIIAHESLLIFLAHYILALSFIEINSEFHSVRFILNHRAIFTPLLHSGRERRLCQYVVNLIRRFHVIQGEHVVVLTRKLGAPILNREIVSRWNLRVLINTYILIHVSITDYKRLNEQNNTLFIVIDSSRFIITLS